MGDVASGIKAFKKGMAEDEDAKLAEEKAKLEAAAAAKTAEQAQASTTKTN